MGDDQQLRRALELGEYFDQAGQVDVVERRLHLVHHVERRRPGHEDGNEEGHGGERTLASRKKGEPLDPFARRTRLYFDAGGENVVVGEDEAALPARKKACKNFREALRHVLYRARHNFLHALVDRADDSKKVLARPFEIRQLLG